ncbi:MAG: asparagine synthase (glutamine-hydrolyzing) [Gemmatimonadaceae bacterium]|nr:asparagine synthase (glutamine-hydrolyzing) [Gemmatimonadaceae bacterium]
MHAPSAPPVAAAALRRMCDAIRHRGPDDEGMLVEGPVGIGMRRLSIIDLAGGHQPVFNEDRSVAIVYNGEVYNYRGLRDGLISRGHVMRTHSDTETIVHLYEELGDACVEKLRGMFAFAIWDAKRDRLLLARDRFGIKPLYVVQAEWGLAFSSELKALHAVGMTGGSLDWEALQAHFRVGYLPAPRSPFQAVRKLEPGHVLTWERSKRPETRRYWDVPTQRAQAHPHAVEEVRQRLDESVKAHLESDVPVAAFLSGGLDSSAVVTSMALAGERAHAYTVRYQGTGAARADESPLAALLAERYGLKLSIVDVEPDVRTILPQIVRALDEPHADESAVPTWLLCERVAAEYKVALVGTGGDELFGGYRRHFALAAAAMWQRVPRGIRSAAASLGARMGEPSDGGLGIARVKRFLRASGDSLAERYLSLQDKLGTAPIFSDAVREATDVNYAAETFRRHGVAAPRDGLVRPALYLDYKTYLPDDLLHLADRLSMAHSLELRVPFVDHELVEALFSLPDSTRVGLMRPKRLLRRALAPRLPKAHFTAPKRGFVGPTAAWLRNELAEVLADELSASRIGRLGFFNPEVVDRLRREHAEGRQNHEGVLWALLCFSLWHQSFVESAAVEAYRPGHLLPSGP